MKMKSIIKILFVVCFSMGIAGVAQAEVILESATLGTTGVNSGWSLNSGQFLGARFQITETTIIECFGGHMYGGGTNLFGGIVSLSSDSDLPDGTVNDSDFIYINLFDPETPSTDLLVAANIVLQPGYYGVVFGSGEFGADSSGAMPFESGLDTPAASYFFWDGTTWLDNGLHDARFVVANGADCDGAIESTEVRNSPSATTAAPVPALANWGVLLLVLSIAAVIVAGRKRLN